MKKMIGIWLFLAIGLTLAIYFIGVSDLKKYKDYRSLEEDMKESASLYIDQNKIKVSRKGNKIKAKELLENGYLTTMEVKKDKCTGYVIAKKKIGGIEYNAYIKCDKYTTYEYES